MGQVGMGLIWEHIYGSCMAYLCAKFGLNWEHKCRDLDLQVLVGWWWGACPGGKVGSLASLWVEATASRWLGLRVVAACGDCGTLWGAMVVRGPVGMTGTFGTCLAGAGR